MQVFFEDLALPNLARTHTGRDARVQEPSRRLHAATARPPTCTWCAPCAARWARRIALGMDKRRESSELETRRLTFRAGRGSRSAPRGRRRMIARDRGRASCCCAAHGQHPLPRPDRPALPQPRDACRCPQPKRGDVLPDGRLGLDGRGAQGPGQALLHPAVPVPARGTTSKIEVVFIRHPTQAQEVDERELLPRHARPAARVVSSALVLMDEIIRARYPAQRVEHLRRPGERRRQLAPRQRPLPRAAGRQARCRCAATSPTCRWPTKSRTCGRSTRRLRRRRNPHFAMRKVGRRRRQIYPVFRDLFKKEGGRLIGRRSTNALPRRNRRAGPSPCPSPQRLDLRADRASTTSVIRQTAERLRPRTPIRTSSRSSPPSR